MFPGSCKGLLYPKKRCSQGSVQGQETYTGELLCQDKKWVVRSRGTKGSPKNRHVVLPTGMP